MNASWSWVAIAFAIMGAACTTTPQTARAIDQLKCTPVSPVYPKDAIADRAAGRVLVKLTVGLSGEVESTAVERSSGDARLDRAAVEAVGRMRCRPADGSAPPLRFRVTTVQSIVFEPSQAAAKE